MFKLTQYFSTKATPQSQPIPGSKQIPNSAGGYTWSVDDWVQLDRFLILGSEGGTYYISEQKLSIDNAEALVRCLAADGPRVIARIVEISEAGRAPKNDPAIFALALAAKLGDDATRKAAYAALPKVCRIGTHLMHFAEYAQAFGGWGRGMRKAVAGWFNARPADELALQLVKYQARDGWSTRDLLRLAHPRAASPSHDRLFAWVTKGTLPEGAATDPALSLLCAKDALARLSKPREAANVIRTHRVPREAVPTELLTHAEVWEALLADMPVTAMIRNLATMTRVGLLTPGANATKTVVARLGDNTRLAKARIHPVAVLAALLTYKSGRGARGSSTWSPIAQLVDALDGAFYATFKSVEPSGKRMLLALDVSGSMGWGTVAGVPGLTPRVGSAAMSLVTAATEREHTIVGFSTDLVRLTISPRQRLDDVVAAIDRIPMGGTDCAQPMIWAQQQKVDVDTFVVYTDNETWAGSVHPAQALRAYRQARGIPAKLVVVGMTSNGFTIADPNDAGMLDVVGFDTATPPVISDFARA
ncbi:MAG: TROVE domain-containing protein [Kofleriaceae bacterium]|nr:MAG: TROVE domain-containing protein [Kofleriaceae bacterium]MBZ0232423.1 TROVE domain-containing protein [Kofleriaceae bacterium]